MMLKIFYSFILFIYFLPSLAMAKTEGVVKPASIEAFSMSGLLNMIMGLVVVIALILGLAWILKKYARLPNNNQVDMKVLGGLSLGTREKAILIEVNNTQILVGVTPGHIQTLHVLNAANSETSTDHSFESKLEEVMDNQQ